MALIFKDRVKETTTTTGQGTITLAGSVSGFRSFADIGNTNTTYYCIFDKSANVFEIGIGTYTASGTTLSRDTVLQTSAGNTTKINFSAGSKEVFCTYPAGKAVFLDSNGDLTINGTTYLSAISNRWTKTATNNQTVFNGNDDAGIALSVNAYTQVFLNGIMLKETTDYALSNNNTITLTSGISANDILESITFAPFNVANVLQPNNNLNDVASASTALSNLGGIGSLLDDTTPQLGGNLDINGNDIVSTSNANIEILPNGTGKVHLDGDGSSGGILASDGLLEIKTGSGSVAEMRFYCESSNAHYVALKSPAHSSYSGNVTLTLPSTDGSSGEYLKTDGSGVLSWDTPSGGSGSNTDILTLATTSSAPTSVAQDTIKLYESSSALHIRSYRGNASHSGVVLVNSAGTQVVTLYTDGDISAVKNIIGAKFIVEGGSNAGRIEIQAPNTSNHISLNAPATVTGDTDYILPEDGSNGEYLKTDGNGVLSWDSPSGGGSTPNPVDISDASSDQPTTDCIRVGSGHDMRIFHYNNKSYIRIANGGSFGGGGDFVIQDSYGQDMISCVAQNEVKLTNNGNNKLTTAYASGVSITLSNNYTFTAYDGSSGQQLQTNGSGTVTWASASSDLRLKKDIATNDVGLNFINELDTKVFSFKSYKELDKDDSQLSHLVPQVYTKEGDNSVPETVKNETEDDIPYNLNTKKGEQRGFIAQEVKATLDKLSIGNFKGWSEDKYGVQEIHLEQFIVPLVKAVQELSKRVEELEKT